VAAFPPSQVRFVNLTGRRLAVQIRGQEAVLTYLETMEAERGTEGFERLIVRAAAEVDGKPRVVYNQRRLTRPGVRYLLLATLGEYQEVQVSWLRDAPPEPQQEAPAAD